MMIRIGEGPSAPERDEARIPNLRKDHGCISYGWHHDVGVSSGTEGVFLMLRVTTLRASTAAIGDVDPLPLLDRTLESPFELDPAVPAEIRSAASFGQPRSMYPYLMQNRYTRDRRPTELTCVELRNERLSARFLPQLGGRLWSLVDRATGRE